MISGSLRQRFQSLDLDSVVFFLSLLAVESVIILNCTETGNYFGAHTILLHFHILITYFHRDGKSQSYF